MKYIYDILLNFNEELYDYYEWKETDYIEYIKKIPIVRLSKKDYKKFKDYKIAINKEILDKLYNTTEVYMDKTIKLIVRAWSRRRLRGRAGPDKHQPHDD
jgi:hypothetical protein